MIATEILPTVHLNGTSYHSLYEGYDTAIEALHNFTKQFCKIDVNARDYYVNGPDAYSAARELRYEMHAKINEVSKYLEEHREHIYDSPTGEAQRKKEMAARAAAATTTHQP